MISQWSCSVVSDSLWPCGLQPTRLLRPWDSPGKNTGVVYHFLLQGIFLTEGSNPSLLYCRQIVYGLSHLGSPCCYFTRGLTSKRGRVPGMLAQAGSSSEKKDSLVLPNIPVARLSPFCCHFSWPCSQSDMRRAWWHVHIQWVYYLRGTSEESLRNPELLLWAISLSDCRGGCRY